MSKLLLALILSLSGLVSIVVWAPPGWGDHSPGGSVHMAAPEIDPSSAIAALTLLLGSVTVLRSRVAKK
jgi:hypothetical protein